MRTKAKSQTLEELVVEGMARALFVSAWANSQDEKAEAGKQVKRPGPGEDWFDYAPPTPKRAWQAAWKLLGRIEELNFNIYAVLEAAKRADGREPDPKEFGLYLAMQSLGAGVSWFDSHARFELKTPLIEFYID